MFYTLSVSYTHLTLPTILRVLISVVAVFFKQKTAYEMLRSLVGSEMCIRDSSMAAFILVTFAIFICSIAPADVLYTVCLLYTSYAADDLTRFDLGGCRFFQAEDGIRDAQESRGLGDVYKRQFYGCIYISYFCYFHMFNCTS